MPSNDADYMRAYYCNNRDRILKTMKAVVKCECGCSVQKSKYRLHANTKKHAIMLAQANSKTALNIDDKVDINTLIKLLTKKLVESELTVSKTQI
jgi:predicted LPLAT superfamily acyltransferase